MSRKRHVILDGGYAGKFLDWVRGWHRRFVEAVKRSASSGFVVLPKHWIVERTFA